jgi:hypothetical protein
MQHSNSGLQTPRPSHHIDTFKLHPTTVPPATVGEAFGKRRSSPSYATPLQAHGRAMRGGAVLMEDARTSTALKDRVMRRDVGQGENRSQLQDRRSIQSGERRDSRRESVLA